MNHKLAEQLGLRTDTRPKCLRLSLITLRKSRSADERWARDFDNWAIVDTVFFQLFDRTANAWKQVPQWAKAKRELTKRAAFALLWSLSLHDKSASDEQFLGGLELIENNANDERNFVKKAVNIALRAIGTGNASLNLAATEVAERLAESGIASARWVGKNATRELTSVKTRSRFK